MNVFTIGDVAKICNVTTCTVSKWFDSGRLKGYRIPGSQARRVPKEYLLRFCKEHGICPEFCETHVLIFSEDRLLLEPLQETFARIGGFNLHIADTEFSAGLAVQANVPDFIIVDFGDEHESRLAFCQQLRKHPCLRFTPMVGIVRENSPANFDRSSLNDIHKVPVDCDELVEQCQTLTKAK